MDCRRGCGACCIAASIHQPLPDMPQGKPAGVMCVNLDTATLECRIWGQDNYPAVCARFAPEPDVCGENRVEALARITALEIETS